MCKKEKNSVYVCPVKIATSYDDGISISCKKNKNVKSDVIKGKHGYSCGSVRGLL